ncbi:MAG TPA: efflux RND transporter periplasmic adaptor subunit [Azospirillaceae bacterium]|nr:efflux RND transporter periplasmic adaptor subunit [Azospirillaceae bacterium]
MTMKRMALGLAAVLAILVAAGWWYADVRAQTETPPDTVAVRIGDIERTVTAQGKVEPLESVDVGTQVSGLVERILVQPGDPVKAGTLLAVIDPTVYKAQVAADRATLLGLEAQLVERRAMLTLAEKQQKRNAELFKANAASRELLDSSMAEAEAAKARVAVLEAEIGKARSTLAANEANLSYTEIRAPMDGTVMSLSARRGQTINARQSAPTILQIANLEAMMVKAQVSEADVGKLRPGMEVYFTTLGNPGRRWTGKLRQILPTPEVVNDVVLYHALFEVENADRRLMPQMTAQVFFVLDRAEGVPILPVSALKPDPGGNRHTVQVVDGDGPGTRTGTTRTVRVGIQDRVNAQIAEGLAPGDRVVAGFGATARGGPRDRGPGRS